MRRWHPDATCAAAGRRPNARRACGVSPPTPSGRCGTGCGIASSDGGSGGSFRSRPISSILRAWRLSSSSNAMAVSMPSPVNTTAEMQRCAVRAGGFSGSGTTTSFKTALGCFSESSKHSAARLRDPPPQAGEGSPRSGRVGARKLPGRRWLRRGRGCAALRRHAGLRSVGLRNGRRPCRRRLLPRRQR